MKFNNKAAGSRMFLVGSAVAALLIAPPVMADENHKVTRADGHAPIGVMGDHLHKKGEWMFSYRRMHMVMDGNRIGDESVSDADILAVPNRFGPMPAGLRVIPSKMTMDMDMFGFMVAPSDNVTLMAMLNFVEKEMDHTTYNAAGTAVLGTFKAKARGIGDLPLTALIRLYDDDVHHFHLNAGVSAPVGSIIKRDEIFTPMMGGTWTTVRLPYAMQLGSGTWDALPGITYHGKAGDFTWGAQYRATLRMEDENDEGYRLGDIHEGTAWVAYQWAPWISTSVRVIGKTQDSIHGIDAEISGPNQTANPDFYGGETVSLVGGVNFAVQDGLFGGHRVAIEAGAPVYQDLNGPQMETDWTLTVGWQKAF